MKNLLIIFVVTALMCSCMVTRTTVGDGPVGTKGKTECYSSSKQFYLFWGAFKMGSNSPRVPEHGNVQVKTSIGAVDGIIAAFTGGIVSCQTIKIIVKKDK